MDADVQRRLRETGLPDKAPLGLVFRKGNRLLEPVWVAGGEFWVIGEEPGGIVLFGLSPGNGAVLALNAQGRTPVRFVNSELGLFLLFLRRFDTRLASRRGLGRKVPGIVRELETEFAEWDAPAVASEDTWWSLIL